MGASLEGAVSGLPREASWDLPWMSVFSKCPQWVTEQDFCTLD